MFQKENDDIKTCSICGKTFSGFGNNPSPWGKGKCCKECDDSYVFVGRLLFPRNSEALYKELESRTWTPELIDMFIGKYIEMLKNQNDNPQRY